MLFQPLAVVIAALAVAGASAQADQEAQARLTTSSLCVTGSSTARDGYTMHYQEWKMPSVESDSGFVVDSSWRSQHEIGDPSVTLLEIPSLPTLISGSP